MWRVLARTREIQRATRSLVAHLPYAFAMDDARCYQVVVCEGPTCGGCHDSPALTDELTGLVQVRGLRSRARVFSSLCLGRCGQGPNLVVRQLDGDERLAIEPTMYELEEGVTLYSDVQQPRLDELVTKHLQQDQPVPGWAEPY